MSDGIKMRLLTFAVVCLTSVSLYANSGPDKSIEVYTTAGCPKCNTAVNFLKKNWGPVGWNTVPRGTLVYPVSNKEYKKNLELLFSDSTDVEIRDIKFPVIIMRNNGEPFPVYYNIENVEDLLKCKLTTGNCRQTSYKSGSIRYGSYGEILTLDDNDRSKTETVNLPDGSIYTGKMKNGMMHGQGILKFPDGSVYTGMMKKGMMNGQGVLTYSNGDKYDGRWRDNLMDGYGTYNWSDGSWYQGNYRKGKFHGHGTLTTAGESGNQQSGKFKDGKYIGY